MCFVLSSRVLCIVFSCALYCLLVCFVLSSRVLCIYFIYTYLFNKKQLYKKKYRNLNIKKHQYLDLLTLRNTNVLFSEIKSIYEFETGRIVECINTLYTFEFLENNSE